MQDVKFMTRDGHKRGGIGCMKSEEGSDLLQDYDAP